MRRLDAEIARPAPLDDITPILTELQSASDGFCNQGAEACSLPEEWERCLTVAQDHCSMIQELLSVALATGESESELDILRLVRALKDMSRKLRQMTLHRTGS